MRRLLAVLMVGSVAMLGGCAHVLSEDVVAAARPDIDLAAVRQNPQAYQGELVIVGGMLIETRVGQKGTTLEVLAYDLDRWGEPRSPAEGAGRFLARTERFLDPALFRSGMWITLAGRVAGTETGSIGELDYRYPLLEIIEAYLRPPAGSVDYYPYVYGYHRYPYGLRAYGPYGYPYYLPYWHRYDYTFPPYTPWYDPPGFYLR